MQPERSTNGCAAFGCSPMPMSAFTIRSSSSPMASASLGEISGSSGVWDKLCDS